MLFNAFYHSLGKYMHTQKKLKISSLDESIYKKSKWTECKKPITFFIVKNIINQCLKCTRNLKKKVLF